MIDIHCHVLPFVDYDGPQTLEESLKMLECAHRAGLDCVMATPHVVTSDSSVKMEQIMDSFVLLRENALRENLNVDLRLGAEVYISADLHEFVGRERVSLGGNGLYVLVELPMHEVPPYAQSQLLSLVSDGVTPILAHPERNLGVIRKHDFLFTLSAAGVLFQLNSGSLLGSFGRDVKRAADALLGSGLCHFVASDAHNSGGRGFATADARATVQKILGEPEARVIFEDNPRRVLEQ